MRDCDANTCDPCSVENCDLAGGCTCATSTSNRNCVDVLAAGGTTSGAYWIDPDGAGPDEPWQASCDQETSGGGWTLIVRQKAFGLWAKWDFNFDPVQSAGSYVPDINADSNFYREHTDLTVDQYMFRTGGGTFSLVTDTAFLNGPYENQPQSVLADSSGATDTAYAWFFRDTNLEDSWISIGDHYTSNAVILYGEAGNGAYLTYKSLFGGTAVFVRAVP